MTSTPSAARVGPLVAWLVCALIALAQYGNFYVYDSIGPVADLLQQQRGFSDSQVGLLRCRAPSARPACARGW